MPNSSDQPLERDVLIRNARLRLIELEIESHRIKAELARLEAVREDAAADRLAKVFPEAKLSGVSTEVWKRVLPWEANDEEPAQATSNLPESPQVIRSPAAPGGEAAPGSSVGRHHPRRRKRARRPRRSFKLRFAPAWVVSMAVHFAVLLLFGFFTFTTLQNEALSLMVSPSKSPDELLEAPVDVEFQQPELDDEVVQEVVLDSTDLELESPSLTEFADPAENVGAVVSSDLGFLDSVPSDVGTLMAGVGGQDGRSGSSRRAARSTFFGTASEGKRFVFVVDNSGSMQKGRMETTYLELLRSVESMSGDQYFFVIFYSDRAYPLFYPESVQRLVPATSENKQKLRDWLPTVELCTGGQLVEAMELAAKLRPQVVYLLSDGQYGGARTMSYMTEENDWQFVIHTLGMNVRNQQDAQNLAQIAQAHGGMFRLVHPNPVAIQMAVQRPIKYNTRGSTWEPRRRPP